MPIETNDHHIIAKAEGGSNHPDNICEDIQIKTHRNVHNLFGNMMPHSQIDMLLDISYTAWLEDRLEKIDTLFKSFNGEYYKPHCMRPAGTKFKKRGPILIPQSYEG